MNKYLDQLQKLPLVTKAVALLIIVAAVSAANIFLIIQPIDDHMGVQRSQLDKLNTDLAEKQTIANNLNQFKKERDQLEQQLAQAITELPNSAEIDELLRQLNDVGKKAGLEITSVTPGTEAPESFYVKIPIAMAVQGSYEEVAVFFDSVARLRRIVNISNVDLKTPTKKNEKVVLNAAFSATTFRFNDKPVAPPKTPGAPQ
jgi:type IV pilus assembly protein PilO